MNCDEQSCETCKYYTVWGVHGFCGRAAYTLGRITLTDCAVGNIKSTKSDKIKCLNCNTHLKPKTVRCSECLKTEELKNFVEWQPGPKIDLSWIPWWKED